MQLFCFFICLLLSSIYHTYLHMSEYYFYKLQFLDLAGIVAAISGGAIPAYYYYFYCNLFIKIFYSLVNLTIGIIVLLFINIESLKKHSKFKVFFYSAYVISCYGPLIHIFLFLDSNKGMIYYPDISYYIIGFNVK